ncbi:hypothetical protein Hypma_002944 [Hypsizygus marmoreus]|uniref:Uncharacterized protein n=1 Tax=Hypsizygus marmoreus TaxID=39966 RepID=A0A369J7I7_HYPMA|nr:hypothetical protein Hypma_002944 [Hypsizygus marmoreus]
MFFAIYKCRETCNLAGGTRRRLSVGLSDAGLNLHNWVRQWPLQCCGTDSLRDIRKHVHRRYVVSGGDLRDRGEEGIDLRSSSLIAPTHRLRKGNLFGILVIRSVTLYIRTRVDRDADGFTLAFALGRDDELIRAHKPRSCVFPLDFSSWNSILTPSFDNHWPSSP